ncbi:DnaT-like ssDNA-binding domain-containing protein [Ferrimonas marina]|uniref:DnaT-like ssDNA-binding domain-containing protein n=1 Tax=Ferrimonas marina TaxID=299255 RepID=UPI001160F339|nr:DnaT-like ssDNA-binding domain-containing protein [Ferrimonas marina]
MNQLEFELFDQNRSVSLMARQAYAFALARKAVRGRIRGLDLLDLQRLLVIEVDGKPRTPNQQQLQGYLDELKALGLLVNESGSAQWQGADVALPMRLQADPEGHVFEMTPDWKPSSDVLLHLRLQGIQAEGAIQNSDLYDFISYWVSQPHKQCTQSEWDHQFAKNIARRRNRATGINRR